MGRFALREGGRWALALFGALLIASGVSALSDQTDGLAGFAAAMAGRLVAFLRLDFGQDAAQEFLSRGPVTADLVLFGALTAILIGVPVGLLLGAAPLRRATAPLIQIVSAAPVFCAGLALAYTAKHLLELSASGVDPESLRKVLLPSLTVGLAGAAAVQMALRRAASEAQDSPFRVGLRRLGLTTLEIERVYVAPLVLAGLLRSLGEVMLALLSAAVVSEWVFQCRGIADLFVHSVALRHWNMAALILFVFAAIAATAEFVGRLSARLLMRVAG